MAVEEPRLFDHDLGIGVPDHEIGVVSGGEAALARPEARELGRPPAEPLREVVEREAAPPGRGPDHGQPELQ